MPLVPCPDCGRHVSTAAISCPQCGRPNPAEHASQVSAAGTASHVPSEPQGEPSPSIASTPASTPHTSPRPDDLSSVAKAVLLAFGGVAGLLLIIGMCGQPDPEGSSPAAFTDTTVLATAGVVPMLSAEDSARFRQRAGEIVQAHKPTGWPEAERSRMIALTDTVIFFGDTTDTAVRTWLSARRRDEEARVREEAAAAERRADAAKWSYSSSTDPMASRPSRSARIQSENTVEFGFPYEGAQHATLVLRNHPSYGRDVILHIREGQILCPSYDTCSVRVRFDEGPAERWTAAGPADNSSTTIFIHNYSRFVQRMRNAKVVRIQIPVYQEGAPTFEFRVGGFDNGRYAEGS